MLRQETAGYALGKRPPWGSCIMELKNGKGRLHLTMQGLKPLSYEVYLLAGEESIFCGTVSPEKREGRCELKWAFDPDAVGQGKKAEDFHTVLITEGNSAPLAAYFREKQNWKAIFQPRKKELPQKEVPPQDTISLQAAEAVVLERPVLEKKEERKASSETIAEEQKSSFHGSFQGLLAKFRQELEELEETGILTKEETESIRSSGTKEGEEVPQPETGNAEGSLFPNHRTLSPFGDGAAWTCLSLEELTLLSQIPLCWQKEFFFLLPDRRYHHLLCKETETGIWLGVPNYYAEADAADAAAFGFGEFRPVEGDWGYWMAFLRRNG